MRAKQRQKMREKKTTLFTYRENWYDGRPKIYIIFASLLFAFVSVYSFHCVFSTKTKWFRSGLRYIIAQSYNKRFCGFKLTISLNSTSWKIFLCHFSSNFGKQIILSIAKNTRHERFFYIHTSACLTWA